MLPNDKVIKVRNRSYGTVGYSIPEMRIQRKFAKNESKDLTMEELRKLSFQPGGQVLINESLVIEDKQALQELNPNYEPEYFYTEKDVENLLLHGSLEQFLDCLDFAPKGVVDLVRTKAVELEIMDLAKRQAIFEKTGFNVTRQIEINHESKEDGADDANVKQRRVAIAEEKPVEYAGRRTVAPAEPVMVEPTPVAEPTAPSMSATAAAVAEAKAEAVKTTPKYTIKSK